MIHKKIKPEFDENGMTQWFWRVSYHENLKLGENTEIGSFTMIDAMYGIKIEDNVKIGFGCTILSYSSIDKKSGKTVLKKNCKVGSNSVIMPSVTIGENSTVGANSFVNCNIPSNEVWVGNPARYLKNVED
ncbi:MAG: acyltransferase [Methanobacterium sp. ERen5]|nr:MAG: acyltransferase [Methanobacterium sp. ERen5]